MKQGKHILLLSALLLLLCRADALAAGDYQNSVFGGLGVGRNISVGHTEINLLIGYDRYFETQPVISTGVLVEGVFSTHNEIIFGITAGIYPIEKLKFWLAPCFVYVGSDSRNIIQGKDDGVEYFKEHNTFLLKFGGGYVFQIPNTRYSILPFMECGVVRYEFIIGIGVKFNLSFTDDFN